MSGGTGRVALGASVLLACGAAAAAGAVAAREVAQARKLGVFTTDGDIGTVKQAGDATFDAATGTYRVTGNGDDLWAARDDFHFVSRSATGDVALTATLAPVADSREPHSKAGLMIRQDLTPDSPYTDVVVHENGLVALQYRETRGGRTFEVRQSPDGAARLRLTRRGDYVFMSLAGADGKLRPVGGMVRVRLVGAYRVGLFVCSHSDTRTKTVDFGQVRIFRPGRS